MTSKQQLYLGLFLLVNLLAVKLMAQQSVGLSANSLLLQAEINIPEFRSTNSWSFAENTTVSVPPSLAQWMSAAPTTTLPSAYCAADLAFFCRLEVKLEKATKIPVRFRIGDVQQVDYQEGKFEGWRYGY